MKALISTVVIISSVFLTACDAPNNAPDQCLRQEIFKQCVANLPKGPTHLTAAGNDWSEVIQQCDSTAYLQSIRIKSTIKPECRPE